MPIFIFSPVQTIMTHPLFCQKLGGQLPPCPPATYAPDCFGSEAKCEDKWPQEKCKKCNKKGCKNKKSCKSKCEKTCDLCDDGGTSSSEVCRL